MQKFPVWFGGAQIFFSKASVLFQARVLFFSTVPKFSSHMFCSSVHFFPTAPTFSSHVFCSCFFRQQQNFPFTWCSAVLFFRRHQNFPFTCSAVPFFPTAQIFHSRVLQFLFFRQHKFSSHVYCSSFFPTAPKFSIRAVFCSSFFPTAQIFQPRVASFKLADISTTCDVVYFSFHDDCSSDVFSGSSTTYSLWEISKILQLKSEYVISHVSFSMM